MLRTTDLTRETMRRLPVYHQALMRQKRRGAACISVASLAEELDLDEAQVRRDLAQALCRDAKGILDVDALLRAIGQVLGYTNLKDAVLVGVGDMGRALLSNRYFNTYGVNIAAAFDIVAPLEGEVLGKPVFPLDELTRIAKRLSILIGIIAVPEDAAQAVCDLMVQAGVRAIWNFAPVQLKTPRTVLVQNENLAASLGLLARNLEKKLYNPAET
jgi:redox-sensing transcriptional repressor